MRQPPIVGIASPTTTWSSAFHEPRSLFEEGQILFHQFSMPLTYPAGVRLLQQGSHVPDVFFIDHGLVKITHCDENGGEVIVGLRGPGWVLGSFTAMFGKVCRATATTLIPCKVCRIPTNVFLHAVKSDPALSWHLHLTHGHEFLDLTARVVGLGIRDARHRLECLLWQVASTLTAEEKTVNGQRFQMPLTQAEMAQVVAVSPGYLNKLLKQIEEDGLLLRTKGWYVLPNVDALRARVEPNE